MAIEHSSITDPNIHFPKGFSSASANQVLRKNATGTDIEWVDFINAFGSMYMISSGATTGIDATFKVINNATLGGTLSWTEERVQNISSNVTSGYFSVTTPGIYQVNATISFSNSVAAANTFHFTLGISLETESHATIYEKSSIVSSYISDSTTNINSCSLVGLPQFATNDRVYLMVKRVSGTDQINFNHINFVISKVD